MRVFIVREIESRAFEGIFWAETLADLWDTFDQVGDPLGYEYASINEPGALFRGSRAGLPITQYNDLPPGQEEPDFEDTDWSGFEEDEAFGWLLRHQDELRWKPFPASDEGFGLAARAIAAAAERSAAPNTKAA